MPDTLTEFLAELEIDEVFVPPALAPEMHKIDEWVFGTRDGAGGPYNFLDFVREAATSEVGEYLLIGQAGHGMQSYALHYYLVSGPLSLLLQLGWGGAYSDQESERRTIAKQLSLVPQLWAATEALGLAPDKHLVVALSDRNGSNWAVLPRGMADDAFMEYGEWQSASSPNIAKVLKWLQSVSNG